MIKYINVAVVGATGYIGLELIKLLTKHPKVKIRNICAQSSVGESISKFDSSLKDNHPLNFFQITTIDNVTMDGWIVKPKNMDPNKKYPILFYFYSEPAGTTAVDRYGVGNARLYNGDLREDGYVYVSFDGRGTPSLKGRAWRKAIYRSIGKVNVRDMGMGALEVF